MTSATEADSYRRAWEWIVAAIVLLCIGVTATVLAIVEHSPALYVLAVTSAGLLLGLPIPSPGRRDQ